MSTFLQGSHGSIVSAYPFLQPLFFYWYINEKICETLLDNYNRHI